MAKISQFDPKDMFEASRSLIAGAKIIMDCEGINDRGIIEKPTLPVIVCCALAIEIGIKAFLILEGKPFPREGFGHSLKALFEALPAPIQQDILSFQAQFTELTPPDAKAKLEEEDMTFVNWRYAYEHAFLHTSAAFLHDFGVAVSEMLRIRLDIPTQPSNELPHVEQP